MPKAQQYCPDGQSALPLQGMNEPPQVAPGGRQLRTALVPVLLGSVTQHWPPPLATAQAGPPQGTVAWTQAPFRHS